MPNIFTSDSKYKKQARFVAILWTLLILLGCFMPARNVPKVDVPLADKWVHFTFFGGFTFLWLLSKPSLKVSRMVGVLLIAVAFGITIELLQGALPSLGRAKEYMDGVADSIGGLLGVILFGVCAWLSRKR